MKTIAFWFVVYLIICFLSAIFGWDTGSTTSTSTIEETNESEPSFDKIYDSGDYRVRGLFDSERIYGSGMTSYIDIFGTECRSNGEKVYPNGDVYKDGVRIATEYELLGITHRYDR